MSLHADPQTIIYRYISSEYHADSLDDIRSKNVYLRLRKMFGR